jgi:hypothetical protein
MKPVRLQYLQASEKIFILKLAPIRASKIV